MLTLTRTQIIGVCWAFALLLFSSPSAAPAARKGPPAETPKTARYVFVDCGAHKGEAIRDFRKTELHAGHTWEIFAIEANPDLIAGLKKIPKVTVMNNAVWTEDGMVDFFISRESTLSSSMLGHKKTGQLSKVPIKVPSIDFGKWLKTSFTKSDFVFVQLDIEGAEYDVLDHMLKDGSAGWMDKLFIEFHNVKVNVPVERDRKLTEQLRKLNVNVTAGESGELFKTLPGAENKARIPGPATRLN